MYSGDEARELDKLRVSSDLSLQIFYGSYTRDVGKCVTLVNYS